jgi:prophage maintenance system killer protein
VTEDERELVDLVARLPPTAEERALAVRTDAEARRLVVVLLVAAAYWFNATVVGLYGGRRGPARDRRLVEQVVAAAFQSFAGVDPHPTPFDKAAMLLRGITQGHPFNDGNKRTGFLVAAYCLEIVGHPMLPGFDTLEAEELCVRVSAGSVRDIDQIAVELRRLWNVIEGES